MTPEPLYIVGPTASGKSALALGLAGEIGGEIVNADAFQLYRGMDVCTAMPSQADFERVPHHLFGVIPLSETCDAQRYAELARVTIAGIAARGRIPIITGGSGLYVKSLTHGLASLPSSETLRAKIAQLTDRERVAWLLMRDPGATRNVNLKNDRQVSRALEICLLSGRPQSELRCSWHEQAPPHRGILLRVERTELNARIHLRVQAMIQAGLVDEIRRLPPLSATAEKAIGVRQIRAHLRGELTLPEAVAAIQIATRQYARRQEKWFKRERGLQPLAVSDRDSMRDRIRAVFAAVPGLEKSSA